MKNLEEMSDSELIAYRDSVARMVGVKDKEQHAYKILINSL